MVMTCPMVDADWIQRRGRLENPYAAETMPRIVATNCFPVSATSHNKGYRVGFPPASLAGSTGRSGLPHSARLGLEPSGSSDDCSVEDILMDSGLCSTLPNSFTTC